jgi:hypothetical protein
MADRIKLSGNSLYGELVEPQEIIVRHEVVVRHVYEPAPAADVPAPHRVIDLKPELAPGVPKSKRKLPAGKRAGLLVENRPKNGPSE